MVTIDLEGYAIRRKRDSSWYYVRHLYLVDGYYVEGDPEQGLWAFDELGTCKTNSGQPFFISHTATPPDSEEG